MLYALLDPFSGIAGDMMLGALVDVGLDPEWLKALPARLGLPNVEVRVERVKRSGVSATKVDFDIPPQPHSRGIGEIRSLVARAAVPDDVRVRSDEAFRAIAAVEGAIHDVPPERVHLHEVGAVDAVLDVVGSVWGLSELGVERVFCGTVQLGDGTVHTAHGELPVPAPATLRLLEAHRVSPGPAGSGELVTPTGAALIRVLADGPLPASYVPLRSGYGAGTRDVRGRPNVLRLILAEPGEDRGVVVETLVRLTSDIDDMDAEALAVAADRLRDAGARDVVLVPTVMKKGRPGVRLEVLAAPAEADALESTLFAHTTTLGVRRAMVERHALRRELRTVVVLGEEIRVKVATLPDGRRRAKPELDDVARVAEATGRTLDEVRALARLAVDEDFKDGSARPAS
ncbi:MAG TPA: nickel pincer cofactor biosynthesis protein LarC [Gemmatimonadaceae bacterium]|nr:nickel pincer cofactor biosynthesis protein LarC [Gemmatimonadaceae bacterium]